MTNLRNQSASRADIHANVDESDESKINRVCVCQTGSVLCVCMLNGCLFECENRTAPMGFPHR